VQETARLDGLIPCVAVLVCLACAGPPDAPRPDRSSAWGYVELVPPAGAARAAGGAYGDRRLRDVRRVDYSKPGFMVVYVESGVAPPPSELTVGIQGSRTGARLLPHAAALSLPGAVVVRNDDAKLHAISCPKAGIVVSLAPGESARIPLGSSGEHALFLIGGTETSTVFAAPGPFSLVAASGRFELENIEPGERRLHVWHPRLPPRSMPLRLEAGRAHRLDVQVGVGLGADPSDGEPQESADGL
jgi:hypothetical protein